jgi:PAS domain S-box-containing protein
VLDPLETAEYHFYGALSHASSWESASQDQRQRHFEALAAHHKQLEKCAENGPENFENRAVLVAAEIARIEGRILDTEQLFELAIHSANANGFIHHEALANELAARFYAARGLAKIAHAYLRDARYGYLRWGADGKVRQLDMLYPQLTDEEPLFGPTTTIGTPVEQLDLATVIKVSQAVSSEMAQEKLIDTLMRTAIEHAGAERGVLMLSRGDEQRIDAEAITNGDTIIVLRRQAVVGSVPDSIVQYVARTRENIILNDASAQNPFSADAYIRDSRVRSILCLPLIHQGKLIGVLYLENNLAANVFTPSRIAALKVLASQAAISLENTRLYRDLEEREAKIRRLVDANILGIFFCRSSEFNTEITDANDAFLNMVQYDREDLASGRLRWTDLTPPEWRDRDKLAEAELLAKGSVQPFEKEYFRKDGSRVPVLAGGALVKEGGNEAVAFALDLSERKRAEEALRRSEAYLAEAQRLTHTGTSAYFPSALGSYWSLECYRIFGFDPGREMADRSAALERVHADDRERFVKTYEEAIRMKKDWDCSYRIVLPDGTKKHIHTVGYPVFDEAGELLEMFDTSVDVTEQFQNRAALEKAFEEIKELKDQLYRENLALRDEIDRASMFEEIVGTSTALQNVLDQIAKVAPTDSTVLITGETGTGKELVARALHKRSKRAGRAFVSVNCAALAPSLISSELFGYEKGAFTGATQRRLGRFELADGGTIFLDEVGELPPDTQIALLRVLQEREFERVGGAHPIKVDVRVIAATNRDLRAATSNGVFRLDLFFRLNVFPIEVPPLRERKDDMVMLLEYFVSRYATQAGKTFRAIDKKTLELLEGYEWPGNIRELQNIVERSVILSSGNVFSVDESWLVREPSSPKSRVQPFAPIEVKQIGEREMIETALTESRGRVAGPTGAAAKLGIPATTLYSRIKALNIQKSRFKFG